MTNIKKQFIDISNNLTFTTIRVKKLCKEYEEMIKDLHKSLVFKDNEIDKLKEEVIELRKNIKDIPRSLFG